MSNRRLINPRTGTPYFGLVPEAKARGVIIPSGPVILRLGVQRARAGFGARHIWAQHRGEMLRSGLETFEDVAEYVARIIMPGSPIHFEGQIKHTKVTVVRTNAGIAILQFDEATEVYSVTTAYAARHAYGIRIGQIAEYTVTGDG